VTLVDSDDLMLIGLLVLAAVSVGAIVYLLVTPYISGERRTDKRLQDLTETKSRRLGAKTQADIAQNRSARSPTP
jgi:Flp pilus assembly protein TadB